MNYRHAYHAGNFADVVKHAVLCRVLTHLREKPAAFRVIDTHAGAGRYDLAGPEAGKTLEWRDGIGRLLNASLPPPIRALLAPYLDAVAALNPGGRLTHYPGSPMLSQAFLRRQDRLIACELEPRAAAVLERELVGDNRAKAIAIDGWTALNAYVPPRERRGLVLIDPSFEDTNDFARLARGLEAAHRKWPTGVYLLWYPIKGRQEPDALARRLARSGIGKILRIEFSVNTLREEGPLAGCGLIVVNPPFTLEPELAAILPALSTILGGPAGRHRLDWIAGESDFRHFSTGKD